MKKDVTLEDLNKISGTWHTKHTFATVGNSYLNIVVAGMITGCGIGQVYGLSNCNNANKAQFKVLFTNAYEASIKKPKDAPYGMYSPPILLGTLGQSYWKEIEQNLFDLGFTLLSEYDNNDYRHLDAKGKSQHRQRLYMIDLHAVYAPKEGEEEKIEKVKVDPIKF